MKLKLKNLYENLSVDELKSSATVGMINTAKFFADLICNYKKDFKDSGKNKFKFSKRTDGKNIPVVIAIGKNNIDGKFHFYMSSDKNDRNIYLDFKDIEIEIPKDVLIKNILHELIHWFDNNIDYESNKKVTNFKNSRSMLERIWDFFTKNRERDKEYLNIYYSLKHEQKAYLASIAYDFATTNKNLEKQEFLKKLNEINLQSLNMIFRLNPELKPIFIDVALHFKENF